MRNFMAATAALVALTTAIDLAVVSWARAGGTTAQTVAAEASVTFRIEKMTCAACPITVRKAMESVDGVKSVTVDFDAATATVVFDPSLTTPSRIGAAATNAGYPAAPAL